MKNKSEIEKIEIIDIKVFGNMFDLFCGDLERNRLKYPVLIEISGFWPFFVAKSSRKCEIKIKNDGKNEVNLVFKYKKNGDDSIDFGLYHCLVRFDDIEL